MEFETIQNFMNDNRKWSDGQFGVGMTATAVLKHLRKEADEVIESIENESNSANEKDFVANQMKTKVELADCYLLLLNATHRYGIPFSELHETAIMKMDINKNKRTWGEPNKDGFVEHIKD